MLAATAVALGLSTGLPAARASGTTGCPPGSGGWRVGAAKADITPVKWPVAEAAYGIGRMAVGAAHPFYARSIAIQSCRNGRVAVFTALDSQGYFAAYKEDPGPGTAGYGTVAIREIVQRDTGVPAADILIAATHTHNSPDSVGVWGGGSSPNNKSPYLSRVKAQAIASIEAAIRALRPAQLRVGTADVSSLLGTYPQVSRDPSQYPTDHVLRVLQATDLHSCAPIATLVNVGIHADVAGPVDQGHGQLIDPDWPGRVATDLEKALPGESAVVMAGAVGRTGPSFPSGTDPSSHDQLTEVAAFGDVVTRRVGTALAESRRVDPGHIEVVDTHLTEELAEPGLIPLFFDESGVPGQLGGVMRSVLPPQTTGTLLDAEVQTFRIGSMLMAGAPGEAYPEVETELASRVSSSAPPFVFGLANDQLGYTPPAFEYPVVALVDGGDEGIFTINAHFGDDIINQHLAAAGALGFRVRAPYDGVTAGPTTPPDQQNPPPQPPNPPEPRESPLSLNCPAEPPPAAVAPATPRQTSPPVVSDGAAGVSLPPSTPAGGCADRRLLVVRLRRRAGVRVQNATVTAGSRRFPVVFGRRTEATVDLRGLPRGRYRVSVLFSFRSRGRTTTLRASRYYNLCGPPKGAAPRPAASGDADHDSDRDRGRER